MRKLGSGGLAAIIVAAGIAAPAAADPVAHSARYCYVGDDGVTYNQNDQGARFGNLNTYNRMSCSSGRYVLNQWIRPAFARSYGTSLPRSFYDGYVRWYCGKLSSSTWRCHENTSGTYFTFTAVLI